jgi:DNA-binding transcriptional MerR regulator
MTAAGLALVEAGTILDREDDDDLPAALEAAERQLTTQIEQLQRRRDLLSRARELGAPPDLPPELADLAARIAEQAPAELAEQIRAESVLSAAILGVERTSELQRRLLESPGAADYLAAAARLVQLPSDADDDEVRDVADRLTAAVAALPPSYVEAFDDAEHGEANATFLRLVHDGGLNRAQERVLEILS